MSAIPAFACPVCAGTRFRSVPVLWAELVERWGLSPAEAASIDRQQGLLCEGCGNNLRSMALAAAILSSTGARGPLAEAVVQAPLAGLSILEINPAGGLTPTLARVPGHRMLEFPEIDLSGLSFRDGSWDLVVHSDTLEHVPDPVLGLAECRRVLAPAGRCLFTVPIVPGRLTRSRSGLPPAFHGVPGSKRDDLRVHTEFGEDVWSIVLAAGFRHCTIHALEFPAGLAIEART
jgi:SAM-dependent methyltransferase